MEKNREDLDEAMKIILKNTTDEYIKKMISSIRETPDNKNHITDEMIDTMAMAIEVQIEPGDVYDRLGDLRDCLMTVARFETDRLR